jgi:thioredoxin 1
MAKELLKFQADWCSPCKQLSSIMKDMDLGMPVNVVDIDHDTAMTTKYQIRGVPTLIILEDGKEVKRMSGVKKLDELKQWLEN